MSGRYNCPHDIKNEEKVEELRRLATRGDEILAKSAKRICKMVDAEPYTMHNYPNIVSNATLSQFEVGGRIKWAEYKSEGKLGDIVEAYIWFLHNNFGNDAVIRYICKNVNRLYSEGSIKINKRPQWKI